MGSGTDLLCLTLPALLVIPKRDVVAVVNGVVGGFAAVAVVAVVVPMKKVPTMDRSGSEKARSLIPPAAPVPVLVPPPLPSWLCR